MVQNFRRSDIRPFSVVAHEQLMADIKDDVKRMQAKGNYGDGESPGLAV